MDDFDKHFDTMFSNVVKTQRGVFNTVKFVFVAWILFWILVLTGLGWVAVHFLSKVW